jgi:hypothetical protein
MQVLYYYNSPNMFPRGTVILTGYLNINSHWRYLQDSIFTSWRNEESIPIQNFSIMVLFTAKHISVPLSQSTSLHFYGSTSQLNTKPPSFKFLSLPTHCTLRLHYTVHVLTSNSQSLLLILPASGHLAANHCIAPGLPLVHYPMHPYL